jgi:SAM-dependent methyltransferase
MSYFPRAVVAPQPADGLAIEWEESACLLCDGRDQKCLIEGPDTAPGSKPLWFAVVQCQECGLCFTNPRPSPASMARFYPPAAYPPYRRYRKLSWPSWLAPVLRLFRDDLHYPSPHGNGRLLDFGCGAGTFLQRMKDLGWQETGIDISANTVARLRSELGLRVLAGSLPHPALEPQSFEIITMWQSLEHVHQPRQVLRAAWQLLVPGGRLLVAVPNIDSLPYRLFGPCWYGLDLPRHLTHFTPMTLALMLERTGFRVGPIRMVRHPKWLRVSAERALASRRVPYWHRWLATTPGARLASWYSCLTRQADCILATALKPENGP